jgi:beta-galactosidase/beta-glucuronidase
MSNLTKCAGVQTDYALYSWLSTSFEVSPSWKGEKVLLNFGAVDYEATVFVNGKNAGFHRGGYFRFALDVTEYLVFDKPNEL